MVKAIWLYVVLATTAVAETGAESARALPKTFQAMADLVTMPGCGRWKPFLTAGGSSPTDWLDHYFTQLISPYPEKLRGLLANAYFDRKRVVIVDGLYREGRLARTSITIDSVSVTPTIRIEEALMVSPVLTRITLIHEIAVHLAQIFEILLKTHRFEMVEVHDGNPLRAFSELSAAALTKRILDAISFGVVEREVNGITDPSLRNLLRQKYEEFMGRPLHTVLAETNHSLPSRDRVGESEVKQFELLYRTAEARRSCALPY